MGLADIVVPFGPDTMEQLENEEGPFTITGIPGAEDLWVVCQSMDLENYLARYPKSDETLVISRSEDEARKLVPLWEKAWNVSSWPEEALILSSVRCPFKGGAIALNHKHPDHYSEKDARILERFAEAFSLGYTRHLDFLRLEQRNRELQIGRAVGRVQNAVAEMKSSADIVRVITLITHELEELGLDFFLSAITIIDKAKKTIRAFNSYRQAELPAEWNVERLSFGPDTIERIEREAGPFRITGIPEAENRVVTCMSLEYESYFERNPRHDGTVILSRTEEEIDRLIPQWTKIYRWTGSLQDWSDARETETPLRLAMSLQRGCDKPQ